MTRSCAGIISSRSVRSSRQRRACGTTPIRCISPHPHGQSRLSGSITLSIRGRSLGRLPRLRRAGLRGAGPVDVCVFCWISTSATAVSRSSKASCRPPLSLEPMAHQWLAPRSASPAVCHARPGSARQRGAPGVCWPPAAHPARAALPEQRHAGLREWQKGRWAGHWTWPEHSSIRTLMGRLSGRPSHSAAAGLRGSKERTRRQSNPAKSASNWGRFKVITPSRMAGQMKLFSSSRL